MEIVSPIRYDFQTLYNSNYSYSDFLVPALCVFVIFMSLSLAGATVFNHEKMDAGVLTSQLIFPASSVFGRILPYVFISAADAMVLIGLIFPIFGITMRGSSFDLFIYTFIFGVTSVLLGMVISAVFKNVMMATQVILFFSSCFCVQRVNISNMGYAGHSSDIRQYDPLHSFSRWVHQNLLDGRIVG